MLEIPVIRWGKPYESLEKQEVVHFETGEVLAKVHQANGGMLKMDRRHSQRARDALRQIPIDKLIEMAAKAGDLYLNAKLPLGNGTQTPEEFCRMQSATTGLPEHMSAANMKKNYFVLTHMREILDALTRGLPLDILSKGYGVEARGVMLSYQAYSPVLGMVLPSNSPGVHTLWMPVIPLQIGLVLKPGPQEPWTPYRMTEAFCQAGVPREAIAIYPGGPDVGAAVIENCDKTMIFGGLPTVERYHGNPRVQVHGPELQQDFAWATTIVDNWARISRPDGRQRRCQQRPRLHPIALESGRSRHGAEIADALAQRLGLRSVATAPHDRHQSGARPLYRGRPGRRGFGPDRRGLPGQPGVTEVERQVPHGGPRLVVGTSGCRDYPVADGRALHECRTGDRQSRVHVSLHHGRRLPAGQDAQLDRADAGLLGDWPERPRSGSRSSFWTRRTSTDSTSGP